MEKFNDLISLSKGSGCGCKIQPAVLSEMLNHLTVSANDSDKIVVGNNMNDDCSVYDLGDQYLLQTVDFFTPMVNDAGVFGRAAAANALSDIYAMGGKPIMANAVFSWPLDKLSIELGREVLKAGSDCCSKLGVPLAGGHSIDGQDPLFGLSVTGLVPKQNLKTNAGAKLGDIVFMTKPLGIGMLAAAYKRGLATDSQKEELSNLLTQTNEIGAKLGEIAGVTAMTDITGFGFLGHLVELCKASGFGAIINVSEIPKAKEAESLAKNYVLPDNAMRNWNAFESMVKMTNNEAFAWVVDPQTNGGLLFTVNPDSKIEVEDLFKLENKDFYEVGIITDLGIELV